ncbi:MAG: site-specific integrase [Anaerocolumna sp.]|nr:site-specific integrase [Anaerocolumna sp.]
MCNRTLIYRPEPENGCVVHISTLKTEAGRRTVPIIDEVYEAFMEEYQIQSCLDFNNNEIDGFSGFIFSTGEGNVYAPESINRAIHRITEAYNKQETVKALEEKRTPLILPGFSAHNLRHTFCTRLCENESNLKVIQSVMGHADISTTMDIYAEATAEKKQEVFAGLQNKIIIK